LAVLVLAAARSGSVSAIPHSTNVEPVIERIVSVRADKDRPSRRDWQRHSLADTDVGMSSTRLAGMFHVMFSEDVDPDLALGGFSLD